MKSTITLTDLAEKESEKLAELSALAGAEFAQSVVLDAIGKSKVLEATGLRYKAAGKKDGPKKAAFSISDHCSRMCSGASGSHSRIALISAVDQSFISCALSQYRQLWESTVLTERLLSAPNGRRAPCRPPVPEGRPAGGVHPAGRDVEAGAWVTSHARPA